MKPATVEWPVVLYFLALCACAALARLDGVQP